MALTDVPPLAEHQTETSHGRKHTVQAYHLEQRDGLVVVTQLSPEFIATMSSLKIAELVGRRHARRSRPSTG